MTYEYIKKEDGIVYIEDVKPIECDAGYALNDSCKCVKVKEFRLPDDKYSPGIPKKPIF